MSADVQDVHLGIYWGPRPQAVSECAHGVLSLLERLEAVSPLLGTWYLRGRSRAAALREPVSRDAGTLERLLERGRNRRDFGGEVIEELGYSISMWNGEEEQAASLSVTCGGFSGRVGNVALVKASLVRDGRVGLDPERFAVEGLRSLVEVWQPDWGACLSDRLVDSQENEPGDIKVGWVTYVRGADDLGDDLPERARVEAWPGGNMISLGTPFDPISTDDLLAVRCALVSASR